MRCICLKMCNTECSMAQMPQPLNGPIGHGSIEEKVIVVVQGTQPIGRSLTMGQED